MDTHTHTDPTTVTLDAHARRGLITISMLMVSFLKVLLDRWHFFTTSPVSLNLVTIRDTVAGSTPKLEATSLHFLSKASRCHTINPHYKCIFFLARKISSLHAAQRDFAYARFCIRRCDKLNSLKTLYRRFQVCCRSCMRISMHSVSCT